LPERAERGPDRWVVRRERRIGNWGRASEHIGRRWEEVGLDLLRDLLEGHRPWPHPGTAPVGWVALSADSDLQSRLSRVGLPSPDIIVGLRDADGARVVQAIDLKWHIEFASYKQISADALRELLARDVPGLSEQFTSRIFPLEVAVEYRDGLLFAPDFPTNHAFLASAENQRQEYPIERADVLFAPVDGRSFFSPLPGWQMALLLVEYDHALRFVDNVEGAERYYRLGAGLQGAAAQLQSSIFMEVAPPVAAAEAFAWLVQSFRARPAGALAQEVDQAMAARGQLVSRLREVLRSPYRLSELGQTLRKRGIAMPQSIEEDTAQAVACRELLRQVTIGHREAVRRAGLSLVSQGRSDAQALATLAHQPGHFLALAQAHADHLAAQFFTSGPG
jgi:hypothetical protein